ncbi:MAG TPA: PaaX family transcriptional regulator C-terminal domain-containing protein [Candidatus Baltobacteraceae bacterium]|nr:PaaX family transcriptional regulator C-terminal domain-containing protein [Candidatus Baltobacteraceae bacterium]
MSERKVKRPNSFIFTLYGDLVHSQPGEEALPIGSLILLMASFGLSEPAVRQAVSRMSRQGWLRAQKLGNRSNYAVTERGRRRIEELSPRIYGPLVAWDGRWRLLTYSIAESRRAGRDRLRKELALLGWAPLSSSTWISPHDALEAVREAAQNAGVDADIDLFVCDFAGPGNDRELLQRCWDLDAIAAAYDDFIAAYAPRLEREERETKLTDRGAFVERLWLVHDYRKLTYVDPGLPASLLPAHWPGTRAAAIFREYYRRIEQKSRRFFLSVTGKAGAG